MDEADARIVAAIHAAMDRLTTISRQLMGASGYQPISRKQLHKDLGDIGLKIESMRREALQPK